MCRDSYVRERSLTVFRREFPQVRRNKPLVIVNLQKTPADHVAAVRIFAKTDEVMEGVMKELGIPIPPTYDLLDEPREKQPER